MKKLWFILLCFPLLMSCSGRIMNIQETPTHQAIAYGSGKAMGLVIVKYVSKADLELQAAFDRLMP